MVLVVKSGLLMECVKIDGEEKLIGVPLQDQSPDRLPKQDWQYKIYEHSHVTMALLNLLS